MALCSIASTASAQEFGASAKVRADPSPGSTTITSDQANARPAVLGEPGRALLDAPGTARSSFAGGALIVWGATPDETRSYVDGIELPALFHPSGLRTTVHPALIDRVTLTPGALSADYGRGLGGTVEVETVKLRAGARAQARVDAIDASLSAELGNDAIRGLIGLRQGYFDRVLSALAPTSQGLLAVPSHQDGVARLEFKADSRTRLSATWLGSRDRVTVRPDTGQQTRATQFNVGSLRLDRRYDDGARLRVSPFLGGSGNREDSVFARVPLSSSRRGVFYGLRADFQQTTSNLTLRVGLDIRGTHEELRRQGTLSLPAREGDIRVFAQAPVDQVTHDAWRVTTLNAAPWLTLRLRWDALSTSVGLRLESYLSSTSRQLPQVPDVPAVGHDAITLFPEPRVALAYQALSSLRLEARAAWVHQLPDARDLSASYGNPRLSPAGGVQTAFSLTSSLPWQIALDVTGFYKVMHALAVRTDQSPASLARQLVATGRGSALGMSVAARRDVRDLFFALSYTLSRALRSDPDGRLRRFDFDQPHVFSCLVGLARAGFVASARLRAASGMPRTPVTGHYLDSKTGLAQPLFGDHNAMRLPAYVALDLHAEYGFALPMLRAAIFVDLLNATNRQNVEDYVFAANYTVRRDLTSIPFVVLAGLRAELGNVD